MKKTFVAGAILCAVGAAQADVFKDMTKNYEVKNDQARADFYASAQKGEAPSIESIRDFFIPKKLKEIGGNAGDGRGGEDIAMSIRDASYFKNILPYFFAGRQGEGFEWTEDAIETVNRERRNCLDKKERLGLSMKELDIALKAAPFDQYGRRAVPQAAINRKDSYVVAANVVCLGVDPGPVGGSQVWDAMQAKVKIKKGDF